MTPEDQALVHVFGAQPITETLYLRAPDDEGAGIPVVVRDLDGVQTKLLEQAVNDRYPSEIERAGGWVWETLAHGLVSADGKAFPDDLDRRREIVMRWRQSATERLAQGYAAFQRAVLDSWVLVTTSPKSPGANAGPSSAPRAAGPGDRSGG